MKVKVSVKVKNSSRVEREDVLTQRRRDAECAERYEPRNTLNTRKTFEAGRTCRKKKMDNRGDEFRELASQGRWLCGNDVQKWMQNDNFSRLLLLIAE